MIILRSVSGKAHDFSRGSKSKVSMTISILGHRTDIRSSYAENNLGQTLYDAVIKNKPLKIVEFGTLNGYSSISMGLALKDLGRGLLFTYDLYEDYQYNHSTMENVIRNIKYFGLENWVIPAKLDFNSWLLCKDRFDMCHVDISNNGDTVENFIETVKDNNPGSVCLFEGGSEERDSIEWMIKYNKRPINPVIKKYNGRVINELFPSISEVIL